jgi:hypothetical protein
MKSGINRRKFIGVAGAFNIVPRHVLGGYGYVAPSEKLTLGLIGMGTQSFTRLQSLLPHPRVQIVAIADPNKDSNNYIEWGKGANYRKLRKMIGNSSWRANVGGCPGGREVGREIIDTYYANQRGAEKFRGVTTYADYREMLEQERDIDAVHIITPDHQHATIAIAAMKKGINVAMHKPIANRLHEARLVLEANQATKTRTHLLAYGSGRDNERIAGKVKQGVIGKLREVHNWSKRPVWPQYPHIPKNTPPIPKGFDWDLWLGPVQYRPYHHQYTHTVYRGWYDFGGGAMADMGVYSLWPVFTGLNLDSPISAEAYASHRCSIIESVSKKVNNDYSYPTACQLRFRFAAKGDMPELDMFWYDGGMKPRLPKELESADVKVSEEGILWVGDKGCIIAGFNGGNPKLFIGGKSKPLFGKEPEENKSPDDVWVDSFLEGRESPGSFLSTGAISDTHNLGTVALRAKKKVLFDSKNMKITNDDDANKYLYREYRQGWEL